MPDKPSINFGYICINLRSKMIHNRKSIAYRSVVHVVAVKILANWYPPACAFASTSRSDASNDDSDSEVVMNPELSALGDVPATINNWSSGRRASRWRRIAAQDYPFKIGPQISGKASARSVPQCMSLVYTIEILIKRTVVSDIPISYSRGAQQPRVVYLVFPGFYTMRTKKKYMLPEQHVHTARTRDDDIITIHPPPIQENGI
ncbi:hypothetical protein BD779DRAFT_184010 [Infundibulicybe gibba]|nr:hypothetical protein BD779DRAFT_184010 [Infundibulicybe gibba]